MSEMWTAAIGIFGTILGAGLNEFLRRNRRIESHMGHVFDKRIEKYEELMALLQRGYEVASDVMKNSDYSPKQRHELISDVIFRIARFTEDNELYIDPELAPHCVATFMGAEDVLDIDDQREQELRRLCVRDNYVNTKRMIREESGIDKIDKLFKTIAKPRISSAIIDRIRYLKAHPEDTHKFLKEH